MALANVTERNLFVDNNRYCSNLELLVWIIELLPQNVFDELISDIKNTQNYYIEKSI